MLYMELVVKNFDSKDVGKIILSQDIFGLEVQTDILYRVVHWQLAKRRSGCHKVKARAEVSYSTRKIYRQKGTGQARHGSRKAPIFIGGGIVFGPVVRSHEYSLNKKIRKLGLKNALSLKFREESIIVLENAKLEEIKTAEFAKKFQNFNAKSALIVDSEIDINLKNSSANIHNVNVLPVCGLNVYDILKHDKLVVSLDALKKIEERLA
jgi:large subunit ribosomal protein L4